MVRQETYPYRAVKAYTQDAYGKRYGPLQFRWNWVGNFVRTKYGLKKASFLGALVIILLIMGMALGGCATVKAKEENVDGTITVASTTLQNVVRVTDNKFRKNSVSVSPDGQKLLYCEANEIDPVVSRSFGDYRIMLLRDVTISAKTPLITEPSYSGTWFEDSNQVVYVVYEGNGSKLAKSNITGGGKTYIARSSAGEFDANPSINGDTLLCDTLVSGKRHLVAYEGEWNGNNHIR